MFLQKPLGCPSWSSPYSTTDADLGNASVFLPRGHLSLFPSCTLVFYIWLGHDLIVRWIPEISNSLGLPSRTYHDILLSSCLRRPNSFLLKVRNPPYFVFCCFASISWALSSQVHFAMLPLTFIILTSWHIRSSIASSVTGSSITCVKSYH